MWLRSDFDEIHSEKEIEGYRLILTETFETFIIDYKVKKVKCKLIKGETHTSHSFSIEGIFLNDIDISNEFYESADEAYRIGDKLVKQTKDNLNNVLKRINELHG